MNSSACIHPDNTVPPAKTCSPIAWYHWALDQFNLFDGAPRPDYRASIGQWIDLFVAWLASGAGNRRKRTVGQCLLRSFNDSFTIPGAGDLWLEFGGMDSTNRAGVLRVLQHVRYF